MRSFNPPIQRYCTHVPYMNESTADADASVEMLKLHNIKLLIAFIHTMNIFALINFAASKLKEWVMIDHDCC